MGTIAKLLGPILSGQKAYLGAAGFALLAVYHGLEGQGEQATQSLLMALALAGLRHEVLTRV